MGRAGAEPRQADHAKRAKLSRLLKKFTTADGLAIAPGNIRTGDHVPKGYLLDQFTDAFARYLVSTPDLNRYAATSLLPQALLPLFKPLHALPV